MPFNVLLLPLLGGYVFVSKWNYTRFDTKRHSGERLIIFSALAGVVFLVAAYAACHAVAYVWPKAFVVWHGLVPILHLHGRPDPVDLQRHTKVPHRGAR